MSSADEIQQDYFKTIQGPGPIYSSGHSQILWPVYSRCTGEVSKNDVYFKKKKHSNACLIGLGMRPVFLFCVHTYHYTSHLQTLSRAKVKVYPVKIRDAEENVKVLETDQRVAVAFEPRKRSSLVHYQFINEMFWLRYSYQKQNLYLSELTQPYGMNRTRVILYGLCSDSGVKFTSTRFKFN